MNERTRENERERENKYKLYFIHNSNILFFSLLFSLELEFTNPHKIIKLDIKHIMYTISITYTHIGEWITLNDFKN